MTAEQLLQSDRVTVTAADVAPILGADPHWIRWMAKYKPKELGFPTIVIRSRVKIPRVPFLQSIGVMPCEKE